MTGETKVQMMSDGKVLIVTCSKADFDSIKKLVCDHTGYTEPIPDVVDLQVSDNSQWQQSPNYSKWRDRVGLVGCAVAALLFLIVFVSGIAHIMEIFSQ